MINKGKAYDIIFNNYSDWEMQNAVMETANFKTEIQNDPVQLLGAIQATMHCPISI